MKKRIIRLTLILIVLLNLLIVTVSVNNTNDAGVLDLRKSTWKATLNGEYLGEVTGPVAIHGTHRSFQQGDELIYEVVIPEVSGMLFPTLQMQTHGSGCEVYLNGRLLGNNDTESFGLSNIRRQRMYYIPLPPTSTGETLVIKLTTNQQIYREPLDMTVIGDYVKLKELLIQRYFSAFSIGILLILMGVVMLFVSLILTATNHSMRTSIYTSLLCIDCGIMIHCKYSLPLIYIQAGRFQLAYCISLYFLVPIISLALMTMPDLINRKGERRVALGLIALAVADFMLQASGVIIVETAINIVWVILILLLIMIYRLNSRAHHVIENREQTLYQVTGLRILVEFLIIAILYCGWYEARFSNVSGLPEIIYTNILLVGPMLYTYYQMLIFYVSMSDSYVRNREYAFLSRLAYEDGLTKLPNRSRIDAYLNRLEASRTDYCIVSLDLNGLKCVNDTFGHWAGDKLLTTFGEVLDGVFRKDYFCGRIGGDEFMAILTGVDEAKVNDVLRQLEEALAALNRTEEDPWEYSCAAGYAFRHECREDFMHNTYLIADQRMYRQKAEQHKQREALS